MNQCPKWREQVLLLMWHICQLIAAAIETEGFPFVSSWSSERHPSTCRLFHFICGFDQCQCLVRLFFFFILSLFYICPQNSSLSSSSSSGVCVCVFLIFCGSPFTVWSSGSVSVYIQTITCVPMHAPLCPDRWTALGLYP